MTQTEPQKGEPETEDRGVLATALLSHDIRSALSGLLSASQALESAGLIGGAAVHLAQIKISALYISEILNVAAALPDSAPDSVPDLVPDLVPITDLAPALAQIEAMWAPEAAKKGFEFSAQTKGAMPAALRFPQIDFLRIFNNIIGNAIKFSGGGALGLRLSRVNNGALLIEVVDDGPGFSEAAFEKLFALHGRPADTKGEGSGFGLYIARELAEKGGGEIRAKNQPTGGARVSVLFPEDLLIAPDVAATRAKTGLPDLSHLRILLAEDNPTNQLVATQMLKKMDAKVETASDGVEAIAAFEHGDFNLGLIDIEMPRKSGLEVMREMRAQTDARAEMTLLALTAYVLPEHRERIMAAGADGIIAKPLTDIAAFGNAILIVTGAPEVEVTKESPAEDGPDADIQMDIYSGLKEIIGADSMRELLGKVLSDLTDVRERVRAGVANKDVGPIRAGTHILISVAGAVGAVNLQHLAEALNATAKTGDWAAIVPEAARCAQGISGVLRFISAELDS